MYHWTKEIPSILQVVQSVASPSLAQLPGTVCHHTFKNSPTQTLLNGTLKLFYSNNAIPVLHHRPFLFGFILCVTFVTRWSCFMTVSIELYELMNLSALVSALSKCFCLQVKLWNPLRKHAIPERLRGVITTRRNTNPRLRYLTLPVGVVCCHILQLALLQFISPYQLFFNVTNVMLLLNDLSHQCHWHWQHSSTYFCKINCNKCWVLVIAKINIKKFDTEMKTKDK